jgi:hypothetical protein
MVSRHITTVVFLLKVLLVLVKLLDFGVAEEFVNFCRQCVHVPVLKGYWLLLAEQCEVQELVRLLFRPYVPASRHTDGVQTDKVRSVK